MFGASVPNAAVSNSSKMYRIDSTITGISHLLLTFGLTDARIACHSCFTSPPPGSAHGRRPRRWVSGPHTGDTGSTKAQYGPAPADGDDFLLHWPRPAAQPPPRRRPL